LFLVSCDSFTPEATIQVQFSDNSDGT